MPITIGPFANVPAPGDPIRSPWAQQLTTAVVALQTKSQRIGYVSYSSDQNGIGGADTALSGLGANITTVAGRRYEMRYTFNVQQMTANGTATFNWTLAGVAQSVIDISFGAAATGRMVSGFVDLGILGAGTKVIGLLARTNGGTLSIMSGSWSPGRLSFIDVGP